MVLNPIGVLGGGSLRILSDSKVSTSLVDSCIISASSTSLELPESEPKTAGRSWNFQCIAHCQSLTPPPAFIRGAKGIGSHQMPQINWKLPYFFKFQTQNSWHKYQLFFREHSFWTILDFGKLFYSIAYRTYRLYYRKAYQNSKSVKMSVPGKKVDICVRNFVFEIKKNTTTSG